MPVPLIVAGAAIVGAGLSAYGTYQSVQGSKAQAEYQKTQIEAERKQEYLRKQAMELDAKRRQSEIIRQNQRARSMSLATTTAQGASGGSGLAGSYGQYQGQSGTNLLGVSQNLDLGRQNFGLNSQISDARIGIASAQSQQAFGSGLSSLGGTLISSAGTFGANISSLGSMASYGNPGYYGGSPSGPNANPNLRPY